MFGGSYALTILGDEDFCYIVLKFNYINYWMWRTLGMNLSSLVMKRDIVINILQNVKRSGYNMIAFLWWVFYFSTYIKSSRLSTVRFCGDFVPTGFCIVAEELEYPMPWVHYYQITIASKRKSNAFVANQLLAFLLIISKYIFILS